MNTALDMECFDFTSTGTGEFRKDDLVIVVMGPTGAGKSNIIDHLTGQLDKRVGHTLESYTTDVGAVRIRNHPRYGDRTVVVDTPGFNDTKRPDEEILQVISSWLLELHEKQVFLHGILYLHRITDNRLSGASCHSLALLEKICGEQAVNKVVFVTTMWDELADAESGKQCEELLKMKHWGRMLGHGASIGRFHNTSESAWQILDNILAKPVENIGLQLQENPDDAIKYLQEISRTDQSCEPVEMIEVDRGQTECSENVPANEEFMPQKTHLGQSNQAWSNNCSIRDVVILVMGATGVGKSKFINTLLGREVMPVGRGMTACTRKARHEAVNDFAFEEYPSLQGCRLVIVDTPGFDDRFEDDVNNLRNMAGWLEKSHRNKAILGGVIFLHDISMNRFSGTARRNLDMLQRMVGPAAFHKVVFGTTMWDKTTHKNADEHVKGMTEGHWKPFIQQGSMVHRVDSKHKSTWEAIDALLQPLANRISKGSEEACLRIQKETVDERKGLSETDAGKELRNSLQQMITTQEKLLCMQWRGSQTSVSEGLKEVQAKIKRLRKGLDGLQVPMSRKLYTLCGLLG